MSFPIQAGASLRDALGLLFFSQNTRLLRIETRLDTAMLVPERAVVREAVNQPFEISVDCLATDAQLALDELIGEPVSLRLVRPDGSLRPWHGFVVEARHLGADGGLARYRLELKSWLHFLTLRRDAFAFQDKTALQIIEEVFADYPAANWRIEVTEPLRTRSLCMQYRETDYEFVCRLLSEEGLSFHFEHLDGQALADADRRGHAQHVMVITDRQSSRADLGPLRFTRPDVRIGAKPQDGISAFAAHRSAGPNAVTLGAWNYKQLAGTTANDSTALEHGELPTLEVYDGAGAYRYENAAHAERAASIAVDALELDYKRFYGEGAVRVLSAGVQFTLTEHPLYGKSARDNRFTVLTVEHEIANNLGTDITRLLNRPDLEHGSYRNRYTCAPGPAAIVPGFIRKPTAPGCQTALVVGIQGEPLTTERDLRVKVQFHWQRGQRPNPGGLGHDSAGDTQGNAPGNEQAGTWVRVAVPSAGANWGSVLVPRIGTEVLVDFLESDIDRPVIVAQLYNGQDTPPYSAGIDSGVNHPGVISGLYTHALDGQGSNSWVVDDATGQLRMRFLATHAMSELGLGHLIQQGTHSAQRGSWRGSGFELATQGWASVRAGEGLLISTTARPQQGASVASTQMDAAEAVGQLKAAHDLGKRLSEAASSQEALKLTSHEPDQAVEKFIRQIDVTQDGKYNGAVNGQEAKKAAPGSRDLADPVERFNEPVVLMETPSASAFATPATVASFAGQDYTVAVQGDLHETAAHTATSVSGKTTSLFTHDGGIQAFAGNGPVSIRAHTDAMELYAEQDVTVVSVNDEIRIHAKNKIEMIGGQSKVTLEGGNVTYACPGNFTVKSSGHQWEGPGNGAAELLSLPQGAAQEPVHWIEVERTYYDGSAVQGAPVKVTFADGSVRRAALSADGRVRMEGVPSGLAKVEIGEDQRQWALDDPPEETPNPAYGKTLSGEQLQALYRAVMGDHHG
nr:type VI secretion system Vgr family protein [uncultured Caldimonas sp.]